MGWASNRNRIELAADVAGAAIFAGAVGFAVSALAADGRLATPLLAVAAFVIAFAGLRRIPAGRTQAMPVFEVAPIESSQAETTATLLLHKDPDAPMLRLVGSSRKAGGREPRRSIDNPIHSSRSRAAPPDASQALSDALAQLRQSLR
jgi:hypothetical protein